MIQKTGRLLINGVVGGTFLVMIGVSMLKKALKNAK